MAVGPRPTHHRREASAGSRQPHQLPRLGGLTAVPAGRRELQAAVLGALAAPPEVILRWWEVTVAVVAARPLRVTAVLVVLAVITAPRAAAVVPVSTVWGIAAPAAPVHPASLS